MMHHRTASTTVRRRPTLSFDSLEPRQLLNASPIGRHVADLSTGVPRVHHAAAVQHGHGEPAANHPQLTVKGAVPFRQGSQPFGSGFGTPVLYSPAQVRKAYGFDVAPNQGQGMTVGIVDAFGTPNINFDISVFSSQFGLPQMDGVGTNPTLTVISQPGNPGPGGSGWDLETDLDVEWVHSVAPLANIVLVETKSAFDSDLLGYGIPTAIANGAVVVSNSYGRGEDSSVVASDAAYLAGPSQSAVLAFSTGDNGAPGGFPAFSPNVVAVGGTSLYTASGRGAYGHEVGWSGSGGGASQYFATPAYQSNHGVNFGSRSTPDVSFIADPDTGVAVYDSYLNPNAILPVGGTSLACPVFAGMTAIADAARAANGFAPLVSNMGVANSIQNKLYTDYNSPNYLNDFHDITSGNNGFPATVGYDLVTGIGTPKVKNLVITLSGSA